MRRLVALAMLLLAANGCKKKSTPQGSPLPPPVEGPCAKDEDCRVHMDACTCECLPSLGPVPPMSTTEWQHACWGAPPGNCGTAYPCANAKAACNTGTKKCALVR